MCISLHVFPLCKLLLFLHGLCVYKINAYYFVLAPIDDGAVQRLRDLIVSFCVTSLIHHHHYP